MRGLFFLVVLGLLDSAQALSNKELLEKLKVPKGFKISLYADKVPAARSMTLGPKGIVFVGTREGSLYAVLPDTSGARATEVITLAQNLESPNGVAYHEGALYVGLIDKILRFDSIVEKLKSIPKAEIVFDKLPKDRHHGWKFIAFGPDGKLYIPVGAPCNVCFKDNPIYSSIHRLDLKTKELELVASGVRNTVGFDWHPTTKELWFTDNGRDMMGDNVPADELNRLTKVGEHFGFPFCHEEKVADPEFGRRRKCAEFRKPEVLLDPHGAALGMRFYTGKQFPQSYRNGIFIAQHGSWNRSQPIGYRVLFVSFDAKGAGKVAPFVEGWLRTNEGVTGRPVDVLELPDGSLLISDDERGAIYRVSYGA